MTYPPGPGYPGDPTQPGQYPGQYPAQPPGQQPYAWPGDQQMYGMGPSPYAPPSNSTNGLAITSLVLGIFGCTSFIGLILGIIALGQIQRRPERGKGMAIAGIVLFGVWTGLSILLYAVGASHSKPSATGRPGAAPAPTHSTSTAPRPKNVGVNDMHVGNCINDNSKAPDPDTSETVTVRTVKVVSCSRAHDGQVISTFKLKGVLRPSETEMKKTVSSGCKARMSGRIREQVVDHGYILSYYYPTELSWAGGNRTVTCVVNAAEGRKLSHRIG